MRRGIQDVGVIKNSTPDAGEFIVGINLGWDFVSEHEWGIGGIRNAFGIADKTSRARLGVDARTVTAVPKWLKFIGDIAGYAYLAYCPIAFEEATPDEEAATFIDNVLRADTFGEELELATTWDESAFAIRMKDGAETLGAIFDAIKTKDAMIFRSGRNNPFANAGLIIAIRSRFPVNWADMMREADLEAIRLDEATQRTLRESNLLRILEKAEKRFFALSPRWTSQIKGPNGEETKTAFPVMFWLNPRKQDADNYGYYTVEDLLQWAQNKGPIPKNPAA